RRKHSLLFFAFSSREKRGKHKPPEGWGLVWLFPKRSLSYTAELFVLKAQGVALGPFLPSSWLPFCHFPVLRHRKPKSRNNPSQADAACVCSWSKIMSPRWRYLHGSFVRTVMRCLPLAR